MSLLQGSASWLMGYLSVQAPMVVAMARGKASIRRLLLSPLAAMPATIAASIVNFAVSPLLPGAGVGAGGVLQLTLELGVGIGTGYLTGRLLSRPQPSAGIVDMRGAITAGGQGWGEAKEAVGPGELTLAGASLTVSEETKHFKVIGTTGTGKSTAIARMLQGALERGDRAVIADPDGGYLRRFYKPERGDVILNPFDQRSVKWDLFAEIRQHYDVDQLARSLIPDQSGEDQTWRGYGRTFFSAIARQASASGVRDVGELYRLLVVADDTELATLTRGTPAQPFLEPGNARMFYSLRSVTSSAVASLQYVAHQRAAPFSIRNWVDNAGDAKGGVLFMPYRAGQIAALRSTISAWMRIALFAAMDRPEGDQRLWFVVDELDALGPIDGLKDALARVRKFGGRCVLGFQSIAQVASTYGAGDAHTLVENCGNTFILRCSASEGGGTSRFASVLIGQRQVRRTSVSRSTRDTELFGSRTTSDHLSIEPAVMDSEIEQIPDLCGYLKLASRAEWLRVRMSAPPPPVAGAAEIPAFVPAPVEPSPITPVFSSTVIEQPPDRVPEAVKPRRRTRAKGAASDPVAGSPVRVKRPATASRGNGAANAPLEPRPHDIPIEFEP